MKTAWDYFTHDKPGESFLYEYEGKNVYDMVEYLKRYGLYFADRRENWVDPRCVLDMRSLRMKIYG